MEPIWKDTSGRRAQRLIAEALAKLEPSIAAAFRRAVNMIRDNVSLEMIAAAITRGDINEAARIAGADAMAASLRGAYLPPGQPTVVEELTAALRAGGVAGMKMLPEASALKASPDLTNPESVIYLREHIPSLIKDLRDRAYAAIQDILLEGFTQGHPVLVMARDVRDQIGLTPDMGKAVRNFRNQLETGEMGSGKAPWDRRLSGPERQQARSIFYAGGESGKRVDRIVERYYQSLLNRRAQNIARTEASRAYTAGQEELWRQAEQQGLLEPSITRRVWIVTPDDRLRPEHRAIPGMNPNGVRMNEPFQTPYGPAMGPNDLGTGSINCRCTVALEFDI